MTRFEIKLATPEDDSQLRRLLAASPMDGSIRMAFAREPSYFAASAVDGNTVQVGVVQDQDSARIVGMGSRAISLRYVDGRPTPVGYLSGLRLQNEFRRSCGLLARGYRFLRQLHEDGRAPFYLTTIAADNDNAVELLTSGRAGLPTYRPWGKFFTLAISPRRQSRKTADSQFGVDVRPAVAADRDAILRYLRSQGAVRQFFPVYETHDLFSGEGLLKRLNPEDILLAIQNEKIVGTLALWNQRSFKQTIIHGYSRWLHSVRPLYNAWATLRRQPKLPSSGTAIDACVAAIPLVSNDDPELFQQLLNVAVTSLCRGNHPLLLIGLHERDPLLPLVRRYAGREYETRLYLVYWPDFAPDIDRLRRRVPYLELGGL